MKSWSVLLKLLDGKRAVGISRVSDLLRVLRLGRHLEMAVDQRDVMGLLGYHRVNAGSLAEVLEIHWVLA